MPRDLTQLTKSDSTGKIEPMSKLDKLKKKVGDRRVSGLEVGVTEIRSRGKGKRSKRVSKSELSPNIDFLPMDDSIFISKSDYILEEELPDGYILRKMDYREQKEAEKAGMFDIRKRVKEKMQARLV